MGIRLRAGWATVRHFAALGDRVGRVGVVRDLDAWLRLQFLGVAARTGIAAALASQPGTAAEVAQRAGLADVSLTESFLQLGTALGELRERDGRFRPRGRRFRTLTGGRADDITGLVEELLVYDSPVYQGLPAHLAGAPRADYLAGAAAEVARASRLAEHVVGPFLAALARQHAPRTVLDIGCGTGINIRWIAGALPEARLVGIDVEADVIREATSNLESWSLADRCDLHRVDLADVTEMLGDRYDLVLLAQNLYYWPPEARADVLRQIRDLSHHLVVVITTTPGRLPFGRHLDLALQVTERSWRLPTADELLADAKAAGLGPSRVHSLAPGTGLVALVSHQD